MKSFVAQFIASEKLNSRCDEVFNVECNSRISDQGMTDGSKVMVGPRTWTEKIGTAGSGWAVKDITFFVDDDNNKHIFISRWGEVYKASYKNIGKYLGYYQNADDASVVGNSIDYDYYIVHQTLYIFLLGVAVEQSYTWLGEYDNEADLFEDSPIPEDDLFVFLRDSNSVYYSADWFWRPIAEYYTLSAITLWNNADYPAYFNTVTLPTDWQVDDTARDASAVEMVKVSSSLEASAATYVGSYLLLTSGVYKGKYGYIFDYNTTTKEFAIVSIWNATLIQNGTTYKIYQKKGKYLQITNGKDNDKYYDWSAFLTDVEWYVKTHIEKFIGFPTGGPGIIKTFGNQCYTSIGDSVFISDVTQPLWYNINDSIDLQKSVSVDDFFVWKNKMIAYGNNFTTFINPSVASGSERTFDFKNYGIIPGSCAEVLDDFWFLTYSGQLIPLSETVYWTIYEKQNIGFVVYRYLLTMKRNVTSCFDGRRYYIYWEEANSEWYTCVYDTFYKFWSVYTGIRPRKFIVDSGHVYYIDFSGEVRRFTTGKVTDSEVALDQYISSKDIDGNATFIIKKSDYIALYLENRNQEYAIDITTRTNENNIVLTLPWKKNEVRSDDQHEVLGYDFVEDVNQANHYDYRVLSDSWNVFRWKIRNTGTNGFYLDQVEMKFSISEPAIINNLEF